MKRKTRVLELKDGYGRSTYYPQEGHFFNLFYETIQDYRISSNGHRIYYSVECETYNDAIECLRKIQKPSVIIHKGL